MTDEYPDEIGAANKPPFPPAEDPLLDTDDLSEGAGTEGYEDLNGGATNPGSTIPGRMGDAILRRVQAGIMRGLAHTADQLDETADQLDQFTGDRLDRIGSTGGRASQAVQSFSTRLTDLAEYLRNSEFDGLQRDLETEVKAKPIQTILISAGAGWLIGKILR